MSKRLRILASLALAAACLGRAAPAGAGDEQPDTLLVITGSHLDVGFTDLPSKVRERRLTTLEIAIGAARLDRDFRWTEEGGWVVHEWLAVHAREPERIAALRTLIESGQIAVGASYVNPHAALFPRSLHFLFAFNDVVEKVLGVRPKVAVINDVPSLPEAFVDAAAAAGVEGFLMGPNLAFSAPLPKSMTSGPFVWKSARGHRTIVSADPDSYTAAFSQWDIDPATTKFFNPKKFEGLNGLENERAAVTIAMRWLVGPKGAVAIEQAFDNWGPEAAIRLPEFARVIRAMGKPYALPEIRPAVPSDALAAWKARTLPEMEGEWGGEWEEVRAGCPNWTARLRHAAESTPMNAPMETRLAFAVAMDHSGGLGGGWPNMFTEEQTRAHAAEWAAMFAAAIGPAQDAVLDAIVARNAGRRVRGQNDPPNFTNSLGVDVSSPMLRRGGIALGGPYFPAEPALSNAKAGVRVDKDAVTFWARLDRTEIPGDVEGIEDVGWDVPLLADMANVRAWPVDSKSGAKGLWLRGAQPRTFIAPYGLVVDTGKGRLLFRSQHAFSYRLAAVEGKAHVQALLVRQSRLCTLKGGEKKVFPFADLFPGEPVLLDAELVIQPTE